MKKRKLLTSISSFALVVATSACMESGVNNSSENISADMRKAQAIQYARSIEQYSLMTADMLAANRDWQDGAFAVAGSFSLIDDATFGAISGNADEIASSGFCVAADGDDLVGYQVTWFNSSSDDEFTLRGLGGNAKSSILSELATRLPESSFGFLSENQEIEYFGGASMALPAGCDELGIPQNSPILINEIDVPRLPEDSFTKTEYTTMACEDGKVGHFLLSLDVSYLADGRRAVAGQILEANEALPPISTNPNETVWTIQEENCKDDIVLTTMSTNAAVTQGVDLSMAATGSVGNNVRNNLTNIDCNEAQVVASQDDDADNENYDYPYVDDYGQGDYPGENYDEATAESYTTCGETTVVEDVENVGDVRLTWLRTEVHTTDCGGAAGTFTDSADGFSGQVTHDIWLGNAVYNREVYLQEATNLINASTDREEREAWYGSTIECQRQEDLHISCNTGYPSLATRALDDDTGFHYRRNNSISGWADTVNIVPNAPANPNWNFRAAASNCQWRENDTWGCNVGSLGQTQQGLRDRTHSAAALNLSPTVSAWNLIQPALCEDRRTTSGSCPSGQTGTVTITEGRTYTSNSPGNGSWGGWSEISQTSNCQNEDNNDDDDFEAQDLDGDGDGDCVGYCGGEGDTVDNYNGDDGDDSNNDGGSVLCTYYHVEKGWLDTRTYRGSNIYGARNIDRPTLNGYHYWAIPLIKYMRKSNSALLEKVVYKVLVEGWTQEMAYRTGVRKTGSIRGKIILSTIKPVCSLIGKYVGKSDLKKLWSGFRV